MVGRGAYVLMIIFAFACSSAPPEDIDYPPLPERHWTEPADAEPDASSATLQAAETNFEDESSFEAPVNPTSDAGAAFPKDASSDAGPSDASAAACAAKEVEPNDVAPNELPYGRTCATSSANDTDRFIFRPMTATKVSVASTGFTVFYIGDYSGTFQQQVAPGQMLTVGPSDDAWYVLTRSPNAVSYSVSIELAP